MPAPDLDKPFIWGLSCRRFDGEFFVHFYLYLRLGYKMVFRDLTKQRHQKKINRNLKGLLSKCYKYGKLAGVELALYIQYPEKDEFVFFESEGYSQVAEKVGLTPRAVRAQN